MKRHFNSSQLGLVILVSALSAPAIVSAAGFSIIEGSVSGLGNAFSGGSANGEDASTIFYNPAGMSRLQTNQMVIGAHIIQPDIQFKDDGSNIGGVMPIGGNDGGDAGDDAVVPNFYYMNNINSKLDFGLGVNAPFGLTTNYQPGWKGRYHALKSELITVNINPALSFKVDEKLSLGFGLNYQTAEVTLTSNIDQPTVCTGLAAAGLPTSGCIGTPQSNDGHANISGDSTAWGYNLGMMYQFTKTSRLGFAYRSGIEHDVSGNATFSNIDTVLTNVGVFADSAASAKLDLPAIWSLSYFHALNSQWDVMADYTLTEWSSMQEIRIDYATNNPQGSTIEELKWQDSKRISVGTTFHASEELKLRFGYALDESPVSSPETASARVPDADRTWLSLGAGYSMSQDMGFDVGYTLISVDDSSINRTNSASATLKGKYESEVSILSAQFNWKF